MYTVDFSAVVKKMVKMLTKANRNLMAAKHQENPEIKKIYLRKAQDKYDYYIMWNNVMPMMARKEMGNDFNPQDPMFIALQSVFVEWAEKVKKELDEAKMM